MLCTLKAVEGVRIAPRHGHLESLVVFVVADLATPQAASLSRFGRVLTLAGEQDPWHLLNTSFFARSYSLVFPGSGVGGSIHRAAERAHSRKPRFIHPHTYKVPGRRQAGLISELPSRVLLGNSSLPWGCSQIGNHNIEHVYGLALAHM